jgi:hypothetical protein
VTGEKSSYMVREQFCSGKPIFSVVDLEDVSSNLILKAVDITKREEYERERQFYIRTEGSPSLVQLVDCGDAYDHMPTLSYTDL